MPIQEMNDSEILQRCAKCDAEHHLAADSLEVGVAREDRADSRVVQLPACPSCSSTEFLIRSADDDPPHPAPGSFGHLHRMLVDHAHAELVRRNRVIAALKDEQGKADQAIARPVAKEHVQRWFPKGMKIRVPDKERPAATADDQDGLSPGEGSTPGDG